jgi:hypothetical protein
MALVVSIVASALGALVMCLLVARYGLGPAGNAEDGNRGLLITRFGHALAGVCFAATGILAVVALSVPPREPRPQPATIVKVEPDRTAEARMQTLAGEMKALTTRLEQAEARMAAIDATARRLDQVEGRVTAMDTAARRLSDEVGSIGAHAKQLERTIAALPRRSLAAEAAPKPTPAPAETSPAPPAPVPAPATPPPAPEPAAAPKPRSTEPVVHRPPPPARAAEPPATPRVGPSSARAATEAPPRASEGAAAVTKPDDVQLTDKIRDDWKTIRGGFATAGDDFKSAVRDLGRKLWR